MLLFALPMILGNLLQQLYNVTDTLIVGRCIGSDALAAVGASFTLMTFLTSILLGLCMGSGVFFSMCFGAKEEERMKEGIFVSFVLIAGLTVLLNLGVMLLLDPILHLLQVPAEVYAPTREYLSVVLWGLGFTFLYNFFASLLRAVGNSAAPLVFLGVSALLNVGLDLFFVLALNRGIAGAAEATVIAQGVSAACIVWYTFRKTRLMRLHKRHLRFRQRTVRNILSYSLLTCVQQSVMNFGILMIQGLVNSFGAAVMAAFAAAVKIDAFAYMPVQDFGNAFSTFIAQNHGAGEERRIRAGIRSAVVTVLLFCVAISVLVFAFAGPLMEIFVDPAQTEIVAIGMGYLRIEGACYCGIGCLFLFYGLYRGMGRPGISVVLTVVSLGIRVVLAYLLAPIPAIGLQGIWWAIPIGWVIADGVGFAYYRKIGKSGLTYNHG
ncbi:MATE family efflux transporter [Oscillospiraceae bacterium NSJ-54]|uniref:Probable multidrug resistance protein NorM n=2 Tax=Zongyangia hominis TaxID=2763677 RepID=A0A926I651_9FIRM|nr:MATE family efflux transporter [Zongyangia hominis]